MPAPMATMHLLKEVLRLTAAGISQRRLPAVCNLVMGSAKYQAASRRAGLNWPLPEALDDVTLSNRLCTKAVESTGAPASDGSCHP